MASATEHRPVFNGSLNGNGNGIQNGNGTGSAPKHATRVADDDDSLSTEQFPAFDPSHDGSEEDGADSGDEHYTHAVEFARVDGDGAHDESDDDGAKDKDQGKYVDHVPESEHHSSHHEDDGDDAATTTTTTTTTATSAMTSPSITSPPYWQHGDSHLHGGWGGNGGGAPHPGHGHGHGHAHTHSVESLIPGAITLQDNEAEDEDGEPAERRRNSEETRTSYGRDRNRACWAKSVQVTDYVIVNGSATNIGAFVVWNIRVETLSVSKINSAPSRGGQSPGEKETV